MLNDTTLLAEPQATYHRVRQGELCPVGGTLDARTASLHAAFRERIAAPEFSCVAAKAAFNTSSYAFGRYGALGSREATLALARDLGRFCAEQDRQRAEFSTMVAVFRPEAFDEQAFEARLWAQLRALHAADPADYSAEVSPDPASAEFGFSFAGQGFFVIGLHPGSSRLARAFPAPALVFNAHQQFRRLKADGRWARFQETIRGRELKWQGSLNPNLADYGAASEARQYSGRAVEADWQAPFPHLRAEAGDEVTAPQGRPSEARCPFGHG